MKSKYIGQTFVLQSVNGKSVEDLYAYLPGRRFEKPTALPYYFEKSTSIEGQAAIIGINIRDPQEIIGFLYVPSSWVTMHQDKQDRNLEAMLTKQLPNEIRRHVGDELYAARLLLNTC